MFICDNLTSTESSILSTDHHSSDLRVTQGSIYGLCNAMTHSRTKEKKQMDMLKSLLFIMGLYTWKHFQWYFVFFYVEDHV